MELLEVELLLVAVVVWDAVAVVLEDTVRPVVAVLLVGKLITVEVGKELVELSNLEGQC